MHSRIQPWPDFAFSYSGGGGQAEGVKRRKQSGDNGRPIDTENRTRPRTTWSIDKDCILMNAYQAFGSKFYERPEMEKSLPGHTPDSLRHRYMRIRSGWMGNPRPGESGGGSRCVDSCGELWLPHTRHHMLLHTLPYTLLT